MLADVSASRISTAELEMQAAPAVAAAAGGIVLRGIGVLRRCLTLGHDRNVMTKNGLWW
jgi:hypothetical protein